MSNAQPRIIIIGGGNMGGAFARGLARSGAFDTEALLMIEPSDTVRTQLSAELAIPVAAELQDTVTADDILLLAIKPQIAETVCAGIAENIAPGATIISLMAGFSLAALSRLFPEECMLVRSMPNLPARVGAGMTAFYVPDRADASRVLVTAARAKKIFESVGQALQLETEAQIDIATALSGSGPAYFFLLVEALTEAATSLGLPADQAQALAEATFSGGSALLQAEGISAGDLRNQVTSPGGTTAAAIAAFQGNNFQQVIARGVVAAYQRAREISTTSA